MIKEEMQLMGLLVIALGVVIGIFNAIAVRREMKAKAKKDLEDHEKEILRRIKKENEKSFRWLAIHASPLYLPSYREYDKIIWEGDTVPEVPYDYMHYHVTLDGVVYVFTHSYTSWYVIKFSAASKEQEAEWAAGRIEYRLNTTKFKHKRLSLWRKPTKAVWPSPKYL